jgi:hypothetical protein
VSGTTLPGPGVDLEVCLGIGTIEPGGVWDAGTWNYNTWQESDTSLGDWTDVTCDVLVPVTFGAGSSADGVVSRWEAQTCALTLRGSTYDPRSGPYTGLLGPGLPVRVRWRPTGAGDWLVAYQGQCDDDGFTYDPKSRRAQLATTDGTRIFAAFNGLAQDPEVGLGDTAGERVARIADMVQWPEDRRDIDLGGVALQSTSLADEAWSLLLAVADTDLALLWIDRAGNLAFRSQAKVIPQRTLAAAIACEPPPDLDEGVAVIVPLNITGQQPTVTRNIVSVSRQALNDDDEAVTVTLRDEPSVSRFLAHSYQRTDLIHTDDAWTTTVAEAILMASAWPSTAPASVDLSSRADRAASALLLGLEPNLSVLVSDGVGVWECEPSGWSVTVTREEISGSIEMLDVSTWYGGAWDGAGWDLGTWGF